MVSGFFSVPRLSLGRSHQSTMLRYLWGGEEVRSWLTRNRGGEEQAEGKDRSASVIHLAGSAERQYSPWVSGTHRTSITLRDLATVLLSAKILPRSFCNWTSFWMKLSFREDQPLWWWFPWAVSKHIHVPTNYHCPQITVMLSSSRRRQFQKFMSTN